MTLCRANAGLVLNPITICKQRRIHMKKILILCLLMTAVAYSSQRTVVIEEFTATN